MPAIDLDNLANVEIPTIFNNPIRRLRRYLNDTPELNRLEKVQESTDVDLWDALVDTLEEINFEFGLQSNYTIETFPSWGILKTGALLQILISKGILSARNTLTYQDSGGVTIQDYDKYGRYTNFFNLLYNKYNRAVVNLKTTANVEACYGGLNSEYQFTNLEGQQL